MFEVKGKYTKATILTDLCEETAISQIIGLCNHPAFKDADIKIQPDCHSGEGCVIGTTAHLKEKKIIPNVVGVDIGCGVLTTIFKKKGLESFLPLEEFIQKNIPSGHDIRILEHPLLKKEIKKDIEDIVSELKIGESSKFLNSVGSLGGGNHYLEVGKIDDETFALSVHTGSRNLGKRVCEYFQEKGSIFIEGKERLGIAISEKVDELKAQHKESEITETIKKMKNSNEYKIIGIPKDLAYIQDKDYDDYIRNMIRCQKMAEESRRLISCDIINFLEAEFVEQFDTIHNYIEEMPDKSIMIRKGAISAKKGQKLAIPLNMKDGVIIGVGLGNKEWNESAPHGAGRLLSRSKANQSLNIEDFKNSMEGIQTWSVCQETLDESCMAYKPADLIISQVKDTIDIIYIVKPVYNFKSHVERRSWADIKREEKQRKREMIESLQ